MTSPIRKAVQGKKEQKMKPESHRIYVVGCKCRGCVAKREDYGAECKRVIERINVIAEKGRPLLLSDVAELLPTLPEWS